MAQSKGSVGEEGERSMEECQDQQGDAGFFMHPDANFQKAKAGRELKQDEGKVADS